ncbi:MAG TPA: hypothetical protein ENK92_03860 [Bacteroidetes bacterium]|nr:hypothetical protein [Bacteroidota bacterium]
MDNDAIRIDDNNGSSIILVPNRGFFISGGVIARNTSLKEEKLFKINAKDSDNDDLPDYLEEKIGTNEYDKDTDGDGLTDFDEYCKYKTNPLKKDSDSDGDWNERREFNF